MGRTITGSLLVSAAAGLLTPLSLAVGALAPVTPIAAQIIGDGAMLIFFINETSLRQIIVPDRLLTHQRDLCLSCTGDRPGRRAGRGRFGDAFGRTDHPADRRRRYTLDGAVGGAIRPTARRVIWGSDRNLRMAEHGSGIDDPRAGLLVDLRPGGGSKTLKDIRAAQEPLDRFVLIAITVLNVLLVLLTTDAALRADPPVALNWIGVGVAILGALAARSTPATRLDASGRRKTRCKPVTRSSAAASTASSATRSIRHVCWMNGWDVARRGDADRAGGRAGDLRAIRGQNAERGSIFAGIAAGLRRLRGTGQIPTLCRWCGECLGFLLLWRSRVFCTIS